MDSISSYHVAKDGEPVDEDGNDIPARWQMPLTYGRHNKERGPIPKLPGPLDFTTFHVSTESYRINPCVPGEGLVKSS